MVTGANGFTGQHLTLYLASKGFQVIAVSRGHAQFALPDRVQYCACELTNVSSVHDIVATTKPDWIIHFAAMSKPDACMLQPEQCLLHNVQATIHLGKIANQFGARFMYFSTDFIFGENGPHKEADETGPLNFYGESKLKAEQWVQEFVPHYVIVRPVFIYGPQLAGMRSSFIQWVQQQLSQQKAIKVVNDQQRTPTYVMDICWGVQQIIELHQEGVFHLAGPEVITPYDMAVQVANTLSLDASLIEAVDSHIFPEPVKRAKQSGLCIDKAREVLHYKPHSFKEGVRKCFE